MSEETWQSVDRYITDMIVQPDEALNQALESSTKAGLPAISVSAAQGKLLHILALSIAAKRILEIGTLGGYSTIWMARALPSDGKLITLEYEPKHAEVATQNIARAGLGQRVQVRVGAALDTLPQLVTKKLGPFDFIFIDADKQSVPQYFEWAIKLARPGSLIIVDNVVRGGKVVDAKSTDASVQGIRRFNDAIKNDKRVVATAIQTVGAKGYDGFTIARVV